MAEPRCAMVYTTVPSLEVAKDIARLIVGQQLAACVNIVPGVVSVYVWDGRLSEDAEVVMLIKTRRDLVGAVMDALRERHPYTTPAMLAYDSVEVSPDYLAWVMAATSAHSTPTPSI